MTPGIERALRFYETGIFGTRCEAVLAWWLKEDERDTLAAMLAPAE